MIALAVIPLLAAWILFSMPKGRWMVAPLDALALLATAILWNTPGADFSGLFFAASIFATLAFAAHTPEKDVDALARLHLGASLGIVAATANDLAWSVPAVLFFGFLVQPSRGRLLVAFVPGMAALAGLFGSPGLVAFGLAALWLVSSREILRREPAGLVTRVAFAFTLLVATTAVILRLPAGQLLHAFAFGALGLGAIGALSATRLTTFLTAIALSRAGLLLFAQLGGMGGRIPALILLAASGVSLLLLAAALENVERVGDVSTIDSVPRRLVLSLAALSARNVSPVSGLRRALSAFECASSSEAMAHRSSSPPRSFSSPRSEPFVS